MKPLDIPLNIHAGCVALDGAGVLLLGPSGAGESDLALRLIEAGAELVADDRVELFVKKAVLTARPPASIAGLMEIRGLGIVALPHRAQAPLMLAVRLGRESRRLPPAAFYRPPGMAAGDFRQVPLIKVNGAAPSAPARIKAALAAFSAGGFRDTFNPGKSDAT